YHLRHAQPFKRGSNMLTASWGGNLGKALLAAVVALSSSAKGNAGGDFSEKLARRTRQPAAVICADHGKTIGVGNPGAGSSSLIVAATRAVVAEHDVGRGLADLAMLKGERQLLAVDELSSELLLVGYHNRVVRIIDRVPTSRYPVRVALTNNGASCA